MNSKAIIFSFLLFVLQVVMADANAEAEAKKKPDVILHCPRGFTRCGRECVRLNNNDHCGSCFNRVSTLGTPCSRVEMKADDSSYYKCKRGRLCFALECVRRCPSPYIECGGYCVDPTLNSEHCGGCGKAVSSPDCIISRRQIY